MTAGKLNTKLGDWINSHTSKADWKPLSDQTGLLERLGTLSKEQAKKKTHPNFEAKLLTFLSSL